jgi:hypothetical protein
MKQNARDRLLIAVGIFGVAGFLYLYLVKLFGQHGKPITSEFIETYVGRSGLIVLNVLIFASFLALLPYRRISRERNWRSKGAFIGFLILFGWLLHWPTLLTLILFPILVAVYYRLALREEAEMAAAFGTEYENYMKQTPRFIPRF